MRKHKLTTPQIAFVVGTRAMLAAGIGLLMADKLSNRARRALGMGLVALGAVTTIPAARTLLGN
jgi:sorbitol-specific phosphotransferase system component IIBC